MKNNNSLSTGNPNPNPRSALELRCGGNKFKANTILAIKLARATFFMLQNQTVFDPEQLVRATTHK